MTLRGTTVEYSLKALTDIWTGDADRRGDRLITTGLLGSIRWWFEVLVRGLGGSACDPSNHENRCPDWRKKPTEPGHHCVVCELFGCTGWARKFRFEALAENGQAKQDQIRKGQTFKFRFTELRPIRPEEWSLLDLTLRLIADYGAIGGRTVLKPSDETNRAHALHHRDYGLIQIAQTVSRPQVSEAALRDHVTDHRWRKPQHHDFAWASLDNFWCVKRRYLARLNSNTSSFNRVIGRPEPKQQSSQGDSWLAGRRARGLPRPQDPESKKVFSFKDPPRTFGFVNPGIVDFQQMRQRLSQAWPGFQDSEFLGGPRIIQTLLRRS